VAGSDADPEGIVDFSASTDDDASPHDDVEKSHPPPARVRWEDHPDIRAMINRTQAAIASLPEPPTSPRPKPWWQDHPEIEALKTRVMDEINNLPDRPPVEYRDPIGDDAFSRVSVRELRDARDDLARAKARYDDAVRAARTLGLSWGQIGGIVGVSRQQLHRRYRDAAG
jgi:hypothetical protein